MTNTLELPVRNNASIPAFLRKLKSLIDNPESDDVISWDTHGKSFHIYDGNKLAKQVLPMYFKHNNLSSFIRQLNMYGFRKVNNVESGSVYNIGLEDMEFSHHYFIRDIPDLMQLITRKSSIQPSMDLEVYTKPEITSSISGSGDSQKYNNDVSSHVVSSHEWEQLLNTVRHIKQRQCQTESRMKALKEENEHFFRELTDLKSKHQRQTRIIESMMKLFHGYVKNSRNLPVTTNEMLSITNKSHSEQPTQSIITYPSPKNKVAKIITLKTNNGNSNNNSSNYNIITTSSGAFKRKAPSYTVEFPSPIEPEDIVNNSNVNIVEITNSNPVTPESNDFTTVGLLDSPPTIPVNVPSKTPATKTTYVTDSYITQPNVLSAQTIPSNKRRALESQRSTINSDVDNMEAEIDGLRNYLTGSQQFNQYEFDKYFNPSPEQQQQQQLLYTTDDNYLDDFDVLVDNSSSNNNNLQQPSISIDANRITGTPMTNQDNLNNSCRERNEIVAANLFPSPTKSTPLKFNKFSTDSASTALVRNGSLDQGDADNLPELSDEFLNSLLEFESAPPVNDDVLLNDSLDTPLIPTSENN